MKSSRFTICDTCDQIRTALKKRILSGQSTEDLKRDRKIHTDFISRERMAYQKKKDRARLNESDYCSIIVDGADQSAFGLPHFTTSHKSQRGHALKVKLVGLLEHRLANKLYLYTMTQEHQTGANHVVEVLHRFINQKHTTGPLPSKFYVQLDNCSRENKNRFVLGYCEMLVALSIFESVEVGFLPVGHTHEDVDQAFSSTSARLRVRNAITLEDMQQELRETYGGNVQVEHLRRVANWSGLCETEACLKKVDKVTQWRYFLFSPFFGDSSTSNKKRARTTSCSVKRSCDDSWTPIGNVSASNSTNSANGFLRFCPDVKKTPPLKIKCPDGLADVTKRLESEDGRVNDPEKMIRLQALRDFVFRERTDIFHWDVENCLEATASSAKKNDARADDQPILIDESDNGPMTGATGNQEAALSVSSRGRPPPNPPVPAAIRNQSVAASQTTSKVAYDIGSFVIIRKPRSEASSSTSLNFWVGKVVSVVQARGSMHATSIRVHWYDLDSEHSNATSRDLLRAKFSPCYYVPEQKRLKPRKFSKLSTRSKEVPWCDEVDTDTVEVSFSSLTKRRTIPLEVHKKISS